MPPSDSRQRHEPPGWTLGAVLAGGRSSRFGAEKALARIAGGPLIARPAAALTAVVDRAVVITANSRVAEAAGLPARADRVPGAGPLGGLVTALEWAVELGAGGVLAVAGDMPFLDPAGLRRLLQASKPPATVPVSADGLRLQPLCAWFSVELLPEATRRLGDGGLRLRDLIHAAAANRVPDTVIAGEIPPSLFYMSVNTPDELTAAEAACAVRPERRRD